MSKQKVNNEDLTVGMYVELPTSWLDHDFLTNSFKIKNQDQLKKLKKMKLAEVEVDYSKSDVKPPTEQAAEVITAVKPPSPVAPTRPVRVTHDVSPPRHWPSEKLVTEELRTVMEDRKLQPERKAKAVFDHSIDMMGQLLEHPTAINIKTSKQTIYELADMVLREDATAENLLKMTSHDFYTYTHSVNVGVVAILLSKVLYKNSDAHNLQELAAGFFLHDIGKVNVDIDILNKRGKLSNFEMQHIRTHPYQGYKILKEANSLSPECEAIVLQHHEASNGSGYPKKLTCDEIHPYAKICTIADVFDALTSERPYKKPMKPFEALRLMKLEMFEQFDKQLFSKFVTIF